MCIQSINDTSDLLTLYWHQISDRLCCLNCWYDFFMWKEYCPSDVFHYLSNRKKYNPLLVHCCPCPIRRPVLHKIKPILCQFSCSCLQWPWPVKTAHNPSFKSNVLFALLRCTQRFYPSPSPFVTFHNMLIFYGSKLSPLTQPPSWVVNPYQLSVSTYCSWSCPVWRFVSSTVWGHALLWGWRLP
jgi:hypothetical protein